MSPAAAAEVAFGVRRRSRGTAPPVMSHEAVWCSLAELVVATRCVQVPGRFDYLDTESRCSVEQSEKKSVGWNYPPSPKGLPLDRLLPLLLLHR
jgi:hypothetical protein